jgi:hypothetical protein
MSAVTVILHQKNIILTVFFFFFFTFLNIILFVWMNVVDSINETQMIILRPEQTVVEYSRGIQKLILYITEIL